MWIVKMNWCPGFLQLRQQVECECKFLALRISINSGCTQAQYASTHNIAQYKPQQDCSLAHHNSTRSMCTLNNGVTTVIFLFSSWQCKGFHTRPWRRKCGVACIWVQEKVVYNLERCSTNKEPVNIWLTSNFLTIGSCDWTCICFITSNMQAGKGVQRGHSNVLPYLCFVWVS